MKKLVVLTSIEEVKTLLKKLKDVFKLTRLEAVIDLVEPYAYSSDIELKLQDEGNYKCVSLIEFKLKYKLDWGYNTPSIGTGSLNFCWQTSSSHFVQIIGQFDKNLKGAFIVQIGTEDSENFYPIVKKIIGGLNEI